MSRWAERGHAKGTVAYWNSSVRERIAHQVRYIRHWKVKCANYWEAPDVEADWFVDPPYSNPAGRKYRFGNRRIDYGDLADWCKVRLGQLIVCENVGADWLPFTPFHKAAGATGGKRTGVSHEAIYHRQTPLQGDLLTLLAS